MRRFYCENYIILRIFQLLTMHMFTRCVQPDKPNTLHEINDLVLFSMDIFVPLFWLESTFIL